MNGTTTPPPHVLTEWTPYVTLAEKLHKLAVQLVADGSSLGYVKITYTSSRATDTFDTPLVCAMLAKGVLDVDVSLEGNIILCRQAPHQPNIITIVSCILDEVEIVNVTSMSFGMIEQYNIMVIRVKEKPSKKALNKIDEISAVDEFVFLAF
ncbi:D-3-phosphoglycerate dehydrogenase 1, chloroplastic-like protein [Tanacetum coccineum]